MTDHLVIDAGSDSSTTPAEPGADSAVTAVTKPRSEPLQRSGTPAPPRRWVRAVAFVAVLFTAWHVFASFLWIAPPSPLREVVPGKALSSYMLPFFGQSWSVFAPEPINGDYHFNVRAVIVEGGERVETGWVSATDVELSMIRYNLTPPRAGIQSSELASDFKKAWDALGDQQRAILAERYVGNADQLRADLEGSITEGEGASVTADQVDAYLQQEQRSVAYATQVARAIWGPSVEEVQVRVSRQNIIPFGQRHNPEAKRPEPKISLDGWREPRVNPGQNEDNFARVFREQYERMRQQ
ncbi:DUF5819 family protein [Microbacterium nymphoidis]|uniref:DUF5819 family protein n=1 Tax=Microbacterium nymphoidis TaxID=2898586 RepID=UPI001E4E0D94|nr:DUF5819 family protein [Microbacterium nymphoidis]MCD2498394.1 DUF5819 family protein [Microbacterium nymphoidis]